MLPQYHSCLFDLHYEMYVMVTVHQSGRPAMSKNLIIQTSCDYSLPLAHLVCVMFGDP